MNIQFGKYRNKSYKFILDLEPTYIYWLLKQSWFSCNHIKDFNYCEDLVKNNKIKYNKNFIIYTDGSCPNNGKFKSGAGIGIHFSEKNKIKFTDISQKLNVKKPTNNIAELIAIKKAIELTKNIKNVKIYTDSKYSINVLTKWYKCWLDKGILDSKKNIDIISKIYNLYIKTNVELIHIRAHTGKQDEHSIGNMIADRLATSSLL